MTNLQSVWADFGEKHQRGKTKHTAANRHQMPFCERRHDRQRRVLERLPEGRNGIRVPLRHDDVKQNDSFRRSRAEEKVSGNCLITGRISMGNDVDGRD